MAHIALTTLSLIAALATRADARAIVGGSQYDSSYPSHEEPVDSVSIIPPGNIPHHGSHYPAAGWASRSNPPDSIVHSPSNAASEVVYSPGATSEAAGSEDATTTYYNSIDTTGNTVLSGGVVNTVYTTSSTSEAAVITTYIRTPSVESADDGTVTVYNSGNDGDSSTIITTSSDSSLADVSITVGSTTTVSNGPVASESISSSTPGAYDLETMIPAGSSTDDCSLQMQEPLYYGTSGTMFSALNCVADRNQRIVAMHRMNDMMSSVLCSENQLAGIVFKDEDSAQRAQDEWTWVDEESDNHMIMITEMEACGGRKPYAVSSMSWDGNTVNFDSSAETSWEEAMPDSNFYFSSAGFMVQNGLTKRIDLNPINLLDGDRPFSIPLDQDFSKDDIISQDVGGVTVALGCSPCDTKGTLDFDLNIIKLSDGEGTFSVTPTGVGADITLALSISGELGDGFNPPPVTLLDIPIDGINIANLVTLGPQLKINLGASVDSWSATATASVGATASIPDGSMALVDFQDSANNMVTDFKPTFDLIDPSLDAEISAGASVFTELALTLDAKFKGIGISAGVTLKVPDFSVTFDATGSTDGGDCGDVSASLSLDAGLTADAFVQINENDRIEFPFFEESVNIASVCVGSDGVTDPETEAATTDSSSAAGTITSLGVGNFGGVVGEVPVTKRNAAATTTVVEVEPTPASAQGSESSNFPSTFRTLKASKPVVTAAPRR